MQLNKVAQDGRDYYVQAISEKKALIAERNSSLPHIARGISDSQSYNLQSVDDTIRESLKHNPMGPTSGKDYKDYTTFIKEITAKVDYDNRKKQRNSKSNSITKVEEPKRTNSYSVPGSIAPKN